jgi:4-diphosphocytidyl-2-C-methyl-D-erythritol kinase
VQQSLEVRRQMTPFSLFAPAKINLALHVLGRRADGYHDLDSIVAFADVGDWLTFSEAPEFSIVADGPFAKGLPAAEDNIIAKAFAAVAEIAAENRRSLPPVKVHLQKNLPVASGIGGGSANAAAAMRGFLKIAGIESLSPRIMAAALKLGADVPVCLIGKACRMRGIGEHIEPLARFEPRHAILANPLVAVSTPAVFGKLALGRGQPYGEPISDLGDAGKWRNDLTAPAQALSPVIGEVLAELRALSGVTRTFMSGSGATCVALYDGEAIDLPQDRGWWRTRTVLS